MEVLKQAFESEDAMLDFIKLEETKLEVRNAKDDKIDPYSNGKYNKFLDATSGKIVKDREGNQFASRSPQFNRKAYPYLSEKEFVTKRPK